MHNISQNNCICILQLLSTYDTMFTLNDDMETTMNNTERTINITINASEIAALKKTYEQADIDITRATHTRDELMAINAVLCKALFAAQKTSQ